MTPGLNLFTEYLLPPCNDISIMYNHRISVKVDVIYFAEHEGNTDDIQELRNKIMEVLKQEPYMGEKIPVR